MSKVPTRREFVARSAGALAALASSSALGAREPARAAASARRFTVQAAAGPNVLLIVLDTVRRDRFLDLAARGRLPTLAGFAARGVRYDDAWPHSSWSLPSHVSILTGLLPSQHGADWPGLRLAPSAVTLAEYFAGRGYACGAFSGNSNWVTREYLGDGFLRFRAYDFEAHLRRTTHGRKLGRLAEKLGCHYSGRGRHAPELTAELLRFVDDYGARRPCFAYLTYMDVNQAFHRTQLGHPFWRPEPAAGVVAAAYDRGLEALDRDLAALFLGLERRGLWPRTIIAVLSDHGESFGVGHGDDHDPKGHGTSLYPEQARVPLMVVAPGLLPAGRVVTRPVGLKAVAPTLAALAGDSRSPFAGPVLPASDAEAEAGAEILLTLNYADHRQRALRAGAWYFLEDLAGSRRADLFDIVADPTARLPLPPGHAGYAGMRDRLAVLSAST